MFFSMFVPSFFISQKKQRYFVQNFSFIPSYGYMTGNREEEFGELCHLNKLDHQET
jgi:hypothetical protein